MGVLMGFVVGYYFGRQGGEPTLPELREAATTIKNSDEFQSVQATAVGLVSAVVNKQMTGRGGADNLIASALVGQARSALARRLQAA